MVARNLQAGRRRASDALAQRSNWRYTTPVSSQATSWVESSTLHATIASSIWATARVPKTALAAQRRPCKLCGEPVPHRERVFCDNCLKEQRHG